MWMINRDNAQKQNLWWALNSFICKRVLGSKCLRTAELENIQRNSLEMLRPFCRVWNLLLYKLNDLYVIYSTPLLSPCYRPDRTGETVKRKMGPVTRTFTVLIAIHIMIYPHIYSHLSSALKPVCVCMCVYLATSLHWYSTKSSNSSKTEIIH